MHNIKEYENLNLNIYARDNKTINTLKWNRARRLTKNPNKLIRMYKIFAAGNKRHIIKYKYGIKVLRNVKEAIKFDNDNGNTLWQDAICKEMDQIRDLQTFRKLIRGSKDQDYHTFVTFHMWFHVKFDLSSKSRLILGVKMAVARYKDEYCGLLQIDTVRTDYFLGKIN